MKISKSNITSQNAAASQNSVDVDSVYDQCSASIQSAIETLGQIGKTDIFAQEIIANLGVVLLDISCRHN